jgi:DNA-nicking Smr family endonuclease
MERPYHREGRMAHRVPIDGTLDLHAFRPADAADLVAEYLEACHRAGIRAVRIVHGKGAGALRRTVEAALRRHPLVAAFRTADEGAGGWGATLVDLRGRPDQP